MKIIDLEQRSPEWLEWRNSHITASDIPIILGLNPWCKRETLWLRKKGFLPPQQVNEHMQRGIDKEDTVREMFEFVMGETYKPLVIESSILPWAGASLDGWCEESKAVLEIKCPSLATYSKFSYDTIPPMYMWQILWQMMCTEASVAHYCVYCDEAEGERMGIISIGSLKMPNKLSRLFSRAVADMVSVKHKAATFLASLEMDSWLEASAYLDTALDQDLQLLD